MQCPLQRSSSYPCRVYDGRCRISNVRHRYRWSIVRKVVSSQTETVAIPIDYYKILRLPLTAGKHSIKRAYEKAMKSPPDVNYTDQTLLARSLLIQSAAAVLLDPAHRRVYDQQIQQGTPKLSIRTHDLTGALALLQETGEVQSTIELCQTLLKQSSSVLEKEDITKTLALAYCDLASHYLASSEGIAKSYEKLEEALALLKKYKAAPVLQQQIEDSLQELAPGFVMEQLSVSSPDTTRRGQALDLLKSLVWQSPQEGRPAPLHNIDYRDLLKQARAYLTAAEQIHIYEGAPDGIVVPPEELYDVALACMAEGYRRKWPYYIYRSDQLLAAVEAADPDIDVIIERAICSLLLGNTDKLKEMMHTLQLSSTTDENSSVQMEAVGLTGTVVINQSSLSSSLSTLHNWAASWFKEAVLANFKETAGVEVRLADDWFRSPEVVLFLRLMKHGGSLKIIETIDVVRDASVSVVDSIGGFLRSAGSVGIGSLREAVQGLVHRRGPTRKTKGAGADGREAGSPSASMSYSNPPTLPSSPGPGPSDTLRQLPHGTLPAVLYSSRELPESISDSPDSRPLPYSSRDLDPTTLPLSPPQEYLPACPSTSSSITPGGRHPGRVGQMVKNVVSFSGLESHEVAGLQELPAAAMPEALTSPASPVPSSLPPSTLMSVANGYQSMDEEGYGSSMDSTDNSLPGARRASRYRHNGRRASEVPLVTSSRPGPVFPEGNGVTVAKETDPAKGRVRGAGLLVRNLLVAGAMAVAGMYLVRVLGQTFLGDRPTSRTTSLSQSLKTAVVVYPSSSPVAPTTARHLDASTAEAVIQNWQWAKTAAVGESYDERGLVTCLEGDMLKTWRRQVQDYRAAGRHLQYDRVSVRINEVDQLPGSSRGHVEAVILEQGRVVEEDGTVVTTFDVVYTVEYALQYHEGAGWKIVRSRTIPAMYG